MNETTKSVTSVKVINDAREEEILTIFRTLHSKVLLGLQECDIKPTFNDKFGECGAEDYKNLHQAARVLISAKGKAKKEARLSGVRIKIQGVVDAYMLRARAAKAQMDALPAEVKAFMPAFPTTVKIPLSDIRACFAEGATDAQVWGDLEYLTYKVTEFTTKGVVLVPFKGEEEKVAEKAPESGNVVKAA